MSESLSISTGVNDEQVYRELLPQIESLISGDLSWLSSYANVTAALKQSFDKISWAGFYFLKNGTLVLGPFQGKIACTVINLGRGVCGTAAEKRQTIIVPDVDKFPGHIACDSQSRSEIVVPIVKNGRLMGVLDLDSTELNSFNETDMQWLEKLCDILPAMDQAD